MAAIEISYKINSGDYVVTAALEGVTLREFLADKGLTSLTADSVVVQLNGAPTTRFDTELRDGDVVTVDPVKHKSGF